VKTSSVATFVVSVLYAASSLHGAPPLQPDKAIACGSCDAWNAKREPFRVFGNTYSVGVAGLSSVLVASDACLILLDGDLPQSAPLIADNIRTLGFRVEDIRLIVNSHAHFDHAGGIAALQRASGAIVAASAEGARALEAGEPVPDDPQYAFGRAVMGFPPVSKVQRVADGETLRVGDLAITAHLTPGHTPGSTTWTWRSCEGTRCLDVVYADSLNPVSAPGFKFTAGPGLVESFRRSIAAVGGLPCDILLSVHPDFSDLDGKLERRKKGASSDPFIDPAACRAYADVASKALDRRVAEEK
jgi:metallo-beta-lactamase class B